MNGAHAIAHGDVLAHLRALPDNTFDGLFCDPPYGFRFMGKKWDYDVPSVDVWRECLRVLKPGAPLLAFGGARTFHRMAVGIEDAGFEIRDALFWLYGSGMPKNANVPWLIDRAAGSKRKSSEAAETDLAVQWARSGTALKPSVEPIVLARKQLAGTIAENVATWGVGPLAIDDTRVAGERWPANLILDAEAGAMLDASAEPTKSTPYRENVAEGAVLPFKARTAGGYSDSGGPSRYFYCAKVSHGEREAGCDALPQKSAGEVTDREDACTECTGTGWHEPEKEANTSRQVCNVCGGSGRSAGLENPRAGAGRTGGARNHHPTLKPLALTKWLASLIKPPTAGATLLVPYSGAGSEIVGALQAGWPLVFGIEGEAEYIEIANARIEHWRGA